MAFPSTPSNGQTAVLNNVTYQYISTLTAWVRVLNFAGFASSATNITGGSTGSVLYQIAPGTTGNLPIGNTNSLLVSNGTAPVWLTTLTSLSVAGDLTVGGNLYANINGSASSATNVAGGTPGAIPYQTATNKTSFIGLGPANSLLVSNGTSATFLSSLTQLTISGTGTAVSTTTGALVVAGGAGFGGSVYIGGDLYVDGQNFIVNTATVVTTDRLLVLSNSATVAVSSGSGLLIGSTTSPYISWVFDGSGSWQTSGGIKANKVSFISTSSSTVYFTQIFNPNTNSLDTVIGP